jgi:hypothetical protein
VPRSHGHLTGEQAEHFLERGFVTVRGAFEPADAQQWLDNAWIRFGYDRHDPASWTEKRIHLSSSSHVDARTFAPAAWGTAMDLIGGESRVTLPSQWGDGFIANLGVGDDRPWQPPSPVAGQGYGKVVNGAVACSDVALVGLVRGGHGIRMLVRFDPGAVRWHPAALAALAAGSGPTGG